VADAKVKIMNRTSFIWSKILLFILIIISILYCKPDTPEQKEIDKRHDEIMVIHDEVMPLMKDIYGLKKQLKKSSQSPDTQALILALEEADEVMMDWMANYDKPSSTDTGYKDYLEQQMKDVMNVKEKMLSSIKQANKYLQ